jgi:hypothetical protein
MAKIPQIEAAMRAKDIVSNTFPIDRQNTRNVALVKFNPTKTGYQVQTVTKMPRQRARQHVVKIDMDPNYSGPFNRCPNVKVDCTCARFLYVWNYALVKHDAAIRDRTNQEPPVETNPNEAPGICKHGILALQFLIKSNPRWVSKATPAAKAKGTKVPLTTLDTMIKRVRTDKV